MKLALGWIMGLVGVCVLIASPSILMAFSPDRSDAFSSRRIITNGGAIIDLSRSDARAWTVPEGYTLERKRGGAGPFGVITATSSEALSEEGKSWDQRAVNVSFESEYANIINGQTVEVMIEARSVSERGALDALFTSRQIGNSGWQSFELGESFERYTFQTSLGRKRSMNDKSPLVLLRPAQAGPAGGVEIKRVAISIVRPE